MESELFKEKLTEYFKDKLKEVHEKAAEIKKLKAKKINSNNEAKD